MPDWARLHEFPDIGHADLLEVPDEAVKVVTAFFEEILDGEEAGAGVHAGGGVAPEAAGAPRPRPRGCGRSPSPRGRGPRC